jgi:hypothetical protein
LDDLLGLVRVPGDQPHRAQQSGLLTPEERLEADAFGRFESSREAQRHALFIHRDMNAGSHCFIYLERQISSTTRLEVL